MRKLVVLFLLACTVAISVSAQNYPKKKKFLESLTLIYEDAANQFSQVRGEIIDSTFYNEYAVEHVLPGSEMVSIYEFLIFNYEARMFHSSSKSEAKKVFDHYLGWLKKWNKKHDLPFSLSEEEDTDETGEMELIATWQGELFETGSLELWLEYDDGTWNVFLTVYV